MKRISLPFNCEFDVTFEISSLLTRFTGNLTMTVAFVTSGRKYTNPISSVMVSNSSKL